MIRTILPPVGAYIVRRDAYVGVDNGISGTIGVVYTDETPALVFNTPIKKEQSYTKKVQRISRVDYPKLVDLLSDIDHTVGAVGEVCVVIERPATNKFAKTLMSSHRALEATIIAVEQFGFKYIYITSSDWQKDMLPAAAEGISGERLKSSSGFAGCGLFPHLSHQIIKHGDADGLLIAFWAMKNKL